MAIADDAVVQPDKPAQPAEGFIKTYAPIAEQVGKELNVSPSVLLGKWGMETGFGKSIIGAHNLGNIKDLSGQGPKAVDKKEKSNDSYLAFETPQDFGRYYSDFIQRGYPEALNSGSDISKFTAGLAKGVNGSYFGKTTPEEYETALTNGYNTVSKFYDPNANIVAKDVGGGKSEPEASPAMMPPPFQNVTQQEGAMTAGLGAKAGFALDMPAELLRLGKYGIDVLRNPNSPASLQRYANTQLGNQYTNIPLDELEKLTNKRAANQSEVQDIIKTIKGGQPTYPDTVRVQKGYGATARYTDVPVVNGKYMDNGVLRDAPFTGQTPPIDISKYEMRPGVYGYGQRGYQTALPILKGAGRAASTAVGGALTALQAEDALKRLKNQDKVGASISGAGSAGGALGNLGIMTKSPKLGAFGAGVSGLSMLSNLARDYYKASPDEREAIVKQLKNLPSALFSPTDEEGR